MIEKYIESNCRIIVNEFNLLLYQERLQNIEEKEIYAVKHIHEQDITYKLGSSFRQMAKYRGVGPDIQIDCLDFQIEVKYWRWWHKEDGTNIFPDILMVAYIVLGVHCPVAPGVNHQPG